jgi:hypothetical protein
MHDSQVVIVANLCFSEYGRFPFQSRKFFLEFPFLFRENCRKQNTEMELSNMTADQLQALSMAAKSDVVIQKICKRGKFLF